MVGRETEIEEISKQEVYTLFSFLNRVDSTLLRSLLVLMLLLAVMAVFTVGCADPDDPLEDLDDMGDEPLGDPGGGVGDDGGTGF